MKRKYRTKSEMSSILSKYRASNLSQKEFCKIENLSVGVLNYWINRPRQSKKINKAPVFSQLSFKSEDVVSNEITIILPNNVTIKIPIDART